MSTKISKLESEIESYFIRKAWQAGVMTFKFTSPGRAGVPDRILIADGRVLFVELKAPGQNPRRLQVEAVRRMRLHGARCYCISTKEQADRLIDRLTEFFGYPRESDYDEI